MASLVSVSAVTVADTDIEIETLVNKITIKVTVSEEITGIMDAQILDAGMNEIFAIGSDSSKADNKYEFELTMHKKTPTGKYIVRVGGNIQAVKKDFRYTSVDNLVDFYKGFVENKSNTDKLEKFLETTKGAPDGLDAYNNLYENIQDVVTAKLAADETIVNDDAKVKENTTNFRKIYSDVMKVAEYINIKTADEMQKVMDDINFATYTGKGDLALSLSANDLYTFYADEAKSVDTAEEFTVENFSKLYDRANFMCVAKAKGSAYLKDLVDYYDGKLYTLSTDDKTAITSATADGSTELWIKLSGKTDNTSVEKVIENAVAIANSLNTPGGNGGGGGGGGGADRSDSTDVPTTPATPGAPVDKGSASLFNDLGTVEWAREAIDSLAARGVLNGKSAGRFVPNDNVTREEITKIITSAFGLVQKDAECEFADVAADRWSYVYVASASRLGIVNGYGADFGPANKTTREDMAVMIYRVLKLLNINVSGAAQNFSDSANISSYARDAVNALTSAGIINGMGDGTFAPKAYVTRAQIAKVAYELLNLAGGNQ